MFCDRCGGSGANIHIVRMVDGHKVEEILCRECAKSFVPFDGTEKMMRMAFSVDGLSDIQDALKDLLFPVLPELFGGNEEKDLIACPICGSPMHPNLNHNDDNIVAESAAVPADELELLKAEMAAAVREERYEDAAKIRDDISALKAKRKAENN